VLWKSRRTLHPSNHLEGHSGLLVEHLLEPFWVAFFAGTGFCLLLRKDSLLGGLLFGTPFRNLGGGPLFGGKSPYPPRQSNPIRNQTLATSFPNLPPILPQPATFSHHINSINLFRPFTIFMFSILQSEGFSPRNILTSRGFANPKHSLFPPVPLGMNPGSWSSFGTASCPGEGSSSLFPCLALAVIVFAFAFFCVVRLLIACFFFEQTANSKPDSQPHYFFTFLYDNLIN